MTDSVTPQPWAVVAATGDHVRAHAGPGAESWTEAQVRRHAPTSILPGAWPDRAEAPVPTLAELREADRRDLLAMAEETEEDARLGEMMGTLPPEAVAALRRSAAQMREDAAVDESCEGCGERRALRSYVATFLGTGGEPTAPEPCRYCADCAALAAANWNGETLSIHPA